MNAEVLKSVFDKYYEFPISFWKSFTELCSIKIFEKEQTIKKHNEIEDNLYFILEGSCGILLWNENNFICTDIVLENDFICDYLSFLTIKPSPLEVITFEKSKLLQISHSKLISFTNQNEFGDKFWRYANQALYEYKCLQYIQALTSSASEIYNRIQDYQPDILNRIPQKYIASYLSITPQSLSRIRRGSK